MEEDLKISDFQLASSVKRDDHAAFDRLFHRYGPSLFSFVAGILKDEYEAEEAVQEVFLKLWEKRKELDTGLSLKAYLFTIAVNMARKYYRKKLQEEKYKQELALELKFSSSSDVSTADFKNLLGHIDRIIELLPPARREIFILSRKQGLKNPEIAAKLNLSEQTVKNQLAAAQKFLRAEASKHDLWPGGLYLLTFFFTGHSTFSFLADITVKQDEENEI
ncbi:RNA polymerase sigma-70 factor [Gaoshiqia sp. Z1-71]|uniref:RNA polymerase sigma-70 factor n=1 Tax=Gaoshiqia hydrogeniformans TaxID=3290090 RepID=UPI003BF8269A